MTTSNTAPAFHLCLATKTVLDSTWVLAYTIDADGKAHILAHWRSESAETVDLARELRQTFTLLTETDPDSTVLKVVVSTASGHCTWTVANPRGKFEYDAGALVEAAVAGTVRLPARKHMSPGLAFA